jgi:bla regulator protein blaR1
MTQIYNWMQTDAVLAIAKTLLHSLWQSGLAAVVLAVVLRFSVSSRIRYAAGCVALLVIVGVSIGTFFNLVPAKTNIDSTRAVPFGWSSRNLDSTSIRNRVDRLDLQSALPWITPIWLAGVLLFNMKHVVIWLASRRLRRVGVCSAPDIWQNKLSGIRNRLKVARPVVLLESSLAQVPSVVGHVRPVILMPLGILAGLPAEQVELLLMHELAHIRRWDYAANVIQTFIEGIMFYNPAVWWISRVIRTERENCCDDLVIETTNGVHAYAAALTALEETRSRSGALAIAATGGSLVKRIRRLLQPKQPASPSIPVFASAVLVLVMTVVLTARPPQPAVVQPSLIVPAVAIHPAEPAPRKSIPAERKTQTPGILPALQDKYRLWLEQDVVYIITSEERTAFLNLRTDEERDAFVEQFWVRRDPTPGTPLNELKDEHYRRIAYADSHFATRLSPGRGWNTDRGEIYIKYGPPDEIESHPSGGTYDRPIADGGGTTRTFPFELWLYRYIQGVGNNLLIEFVDPKGTGEFRRTTDPRRRADGGAPRAALETQTDFSVIGEVRTPGRFRMWHPTFLEAIEAAQGPTPQANLEKVSLFRVKDGGREQTIVNLKKMLDGTEPDIPVQVNDVISVPR